MLDDLAGKRTGERIQILRERRGLSRPVLAGLVGMSASWLKGIERGTRLPPRLPPLVKLAEALAVGDLAVLAGTDMDLGGAASVPVASFARIPHDAVPAIREAVRDPLLTVPAGPADVAALAARTADAWLLWHQSSQHRTDVGRILPRLVTDARIAARTAEGSGRRAASAVLADVYALVQHEVVWASEAELTWTAADRAMMAAQSGSRKSFENDMLLLSSFARQKDHGELLVLRGKNCVESARGARKYEGRARRHRGRRNSNIQIRKLQKNLRPENFTGSLRFVVFLAFEPWPLGFPALRALFSHSSAPFLIS